MGTSIMTDEDRDLGFGDKVARETRLRFLNRDGSFNVARRGLRSVSALNLYHFLLTMSWTKFLLLVLLLYFLSNVVFGFVYGILGVGALVDTSEIPIQNAFCADFSLACRRLRPSATARFIRSGIVPNLLVTIESYYSLLANALITGLVFARFSRPEAKIIFSEKAIVAPYRGITGLMFRLVNSRNNQLIELKAQVLYARFVEENGNLVRRFDLLNLERERFRFSLCVDGRASD